MSTQYTVTVKGFLNTRPYLTRDNEACLLIQKAELFDTPMAAVLRITHLIAEDRKSCEGQEFRVVNNDTFEVIHTISVPC
jgi:hypothetical protein